MRLITINAQTAADMSVIDSEFLYNKQGRPCLLVLKLKYKNEKIDFAVPLRSNIHPAENKAYYFNLPPRATTKSKHRHGLHFAKMFPINKKFTQKFHIENNAEYIRTNDIIQKNSKIIIQQARTYLDNYSCGKKPKYSVDIDLLLAYIKSK